MTVTWKESAMLHSIPEIYWGEDLSQLDRNYEGEIVGSVNSFWSGTMLVVACTDGKVREVSKDKVTIKK